MIRSQLDKTLCTVTDIADQPDSKYILIAQFGENTGYIAVDDYITRGDLIEFTRDKTLMAVLKKDQKFVMVARALVHMIDNRSLFKLVDADAQAMEKLHLEIHPDCADGERHAPERLSVVPGYL